MNDVVLLSLLLTLSYYTSFSIVSIVDFEQVKCLVYWYHALI